eukprot:12888883-Prorocentrum_lima.AAC.1
MGMGRAFSAGVNWICRRIDPPGWEEADDTDLWEPDDWAPACESQRIETQGLRCARRRHRPDTAAGRPQVWKKKAPGSSRVTAYKSTQELLQGMAQFRASETHGAEPVPFWDKGEPSATLGTHVPTGKELGFDKHSCLYEAVATYLGLREQDHPVSTLRRQCAEFLRAHSTEAWLRWDEVDGHG